MLFVKKSNVLSSMSCGQIKPEKIVFWQPRSQSSSAISDVTSPVKLVGKIRARFQASSGHSDSANRPGDEAGFLVYWIKNNAF